MTERTGWDGYTIRGIPQMIAGFFGRGVLRISHHRFRR